MRHLICALICSAALPVWASDSSWDYIRGELYGDRMIQSGAEFISIDAPYRTPDDARAQLSAHVVAPPGLKLATVSVILDENPMPVSAVFSLERPQERFFFDVTMRVNGPTPLHVVAETSDGQLFVAEQFVKTSGLGACAAPPGTDPVVALETLGQIDIALSGPTDMDSVADLLGRMERLNVDIRHPSHSGMQMDQISLLFIPMRYVETVEVGLNGRGYVDMTGSISLSENPTVTLGVPADTRSAEITMTDTDGTVTTAQKTLANF